MHKKTQAEHLASLMKKYKTPLKYELALPLVKLFSSTLNTLLVNDVLPLKLKVFKAILISNNRLYANVTLVKENGKIGLKVLDILDEKISKEKTKKYKVVKLLFTDIKTNTLEVGSIIDVSCIDFKKVSLVCKNKKIATASLVSIGGEIAIQIDKVENNA